MKTFHALCGALIAAILYASPAAATSARTAVSVSGTDSNPCTPAAPCRTIAYALSQTNPNGELLILSSGGYGPFIVTQAVQIRAASGTIAAISASSGDGITVNAGSTDIVILTGFLIDGLGTGNNGVKVNSAGSVGIRDTIITGFTGTAVSFTPTVTAQSILSLVETSIYNTPGGAVLVKPSGGTAGTSTSRYSIERCFIATSAVTVDGTNAVGNISGHIVESVIRYGSSVSVINAAGNFTQASINRSHILSTPSALFANGQGAGIVIGSTSVTSVGTVATVTNNGYIGSYGNNEMQFVGSVGQLGSATLK